MFIIFNKKQSNYLKSILKRIIIMNTNYSQDIQSIMEFYNQYGRFPYMFSNYKNEEKLFYTLKNITDKYKENKINDDENENIYFITINYNYFFEKEILGNIEKIMKLIEDGKYLEDYEKYPKYLYNFINYYRKKEYQLSKFIKDKFNQIPQWIWEREYMEINIKKLYHFCSYKNSMPSLNINDPSEYKMYFFVKDIYNKYIYDELEDDHIYMLQQNKFFNFDDHKKYGCSFLGRYLKEYQDNQFFEEFIDIYYFYLTKSRIPYFNDKFYDNVINIKKMYYDLKLSNLEVKTMEEFPSWKWSYEIIVEDYNPSKTRQPMFLDNEYIDSMLKNTNRIFIRKNYNFKDNVYNLKTNTVKRRYQKERLSKKKALLRLSILRKIESGDISK